MISVANGGGLWPARNVVGGDFLHLVRLGIRKANDPIVKDSIEVIDRVIKRDLPDGPCWRRYNHDGYGQRDDGSDFQWTGVGRSWPILTGERGHYELAAGHCPLPFITAMEKFANEGGMLTEQLWDAADLRNGRMKRGRPTGAAMPLCWSHAEYLLLVRSRCDGICFDRVEPHSSAMSSTRCKVSTRSGAFAISFALYLEENSYVSSSGQKRPLCGPQTTGSPLVGRTQRTAVACGLLSFPLPTY